MTDRLVRLADAAVSALPHGDQARLIGAVLECTDETLICTARFPATSALLEKGRAATHLLVEPAAQAAATHLAILAAGDGKEIRGFEGFLTTARNVELFRSHLPAEADIQIRVRPRSTIKRGKAGLFKHAFEVEFEGVRVAEGELSSYVVPVEG